MMKFRCYKSNGERGPQVWLDLRKGHVAQRLLNCLQDRDLSKSGKFNINSLVKIDSGEFPVDGLANLGYSKSEIEAAINGRIDAIAVEGEELEALRGLLHSDGWREANGGREREIKRDWDNTLTSPRLNKSSKPKTRDEKIRKSSALGNAHAVASAHSFERAQGDQRCTLYTRGSDPGHEIEILTEGDGWEMRKGAKVLASSKRGASNAAAAAHLNHVLTEFHEQQ